MELIWMAVLVLVPASVAALRAAEKRAALASAAARKSRRKA